MTCDTSNLCQDPSSAMSSNHYACFFWVFLFFLFFPIVVYTPPVKNYAFQTKMLSFTSGSLNIINYSKHMELLEWIPPPDTPNIYILKILKAIVEYRETEKSIWSVCVCMCVCVRACRCLCVFDQSLSVYLRVPQTNFKPVRQVSSSLEIVWENATFTNGPSSLSTQQNTWCLNTPRSLQVHHKVKPSAPIWTGLVYIFRKAETHLVEN